MLSWAGWAGAEGIISVNPWKPRAFIISPGSEWSSDLPNIADIESKWPSSPEFPTLNS